jgi:hypothetical protein
MATLLDGVLADLGLADIPGPRLTGDPHPAALASPLAVAECAVASVAACLTAAADLASARSGRRPDIALDAGHVAAAVRSEVWLRDADGRGIDGFAPLSRLWRAADGWVRTHANYPWHRKALLASLGVPDGPDTVKGGIIQPGIDGPSGAFDASGRSLTGAELERLCPPADSPGAALDCLTRNHLEQHLQYQPGSRIPEFHLIVAAGYLGLAVVAIAVVWWIVRRTDLSAG